MALSSILRPERGFHFEYSTTVTLGESKPGCSAYLLYILPPNVFVDKYELKQRPVSFTLHGHADLELPLSAVDKTPSVLEILVPPAPLGKITVDFPLHARYPHPSASPYSTIRVPGPQAFWACPLAGTSSRQDAVFSRIPSLYVPSFDLDAWSVTFVEEESPERYHEIRVPAGTPAHAQIVEFGTVFTVVVAFFFVARALWKTGVRLRQTTNDVKRE